MISSPSMQLVYFAMQQEDNIDPLQGPEGTAVKGF